MYIYSGETKAVILRYECQLLVFSPPAKLFAEDTEIAVRMVNSTLLLQTEKISANLEKPGNIPKFAAATNFVWANFINCLEGKIVKN